MSTNPPNTAAPPRPSNDLARYWGGQRIEGSIGAFVRSMIQNGRQVAMGEKMRWEENREFYRGNQWIKVAPDQRALVALNRNALVPSGRPSYNSYNHFRKNINARVSLLTKDAAPFEVVPEDNDKDSIDAARQAEKFYRARYGNEGWGIHQRITELCKNGDIDGISWLFVGWDPANGNSADQNIAVLADGTPVQTREQFEALKSMDQNMETLWKMERANRPVGDVVWRVVLPNAISVDPFAIKSFDNAKWICESRIMPRTDVERRMKRSFKEVVAAANPTKDADSIQYEDMAIEGGGTMSERNGVVVHYFYAKPSPDWPRGVFVEFLDKAPQSPLTVSEWTGDLPYRPYTPSPDPGHFIRSHAVGDDLKPVQRDMNQTRRDLSLWKRKMACAGVGIPVGSLRSKSFYNEDGYFEYHAAQGTPFQYTVPSEPVAVFTNDLQFMAQEMERLSGVSSLAQGFSMPNGPEATTGIQMQLQQTEENLSESEKNLNDVEEWGANRSFALVRDNYTVPRTVTGVGVDDAEQFKAFQGAMLRGGRFRVNGPRMPKSKAARINSIMQFAQFFPDQLGPYAAQLIDGDPTEFQQGMEIDRQKQTAETRELTTLATNEMAQKVWLNFEQEQKKFAEVLNTAAQQAAAMPADPMTGQGTDPMAILASKGIMPPNLTQRVQQAGIKIPFVDPDNDNHTVEGKTINDYRKGDAFNELHPLCQQLIREHLNAHTEGFKRMMGAMAQQQPTGQQQGSAANPKGTPSPPKQGTHSPRVG